MPSSSSLSPLPGNKGSATLSSALTEERLRDFNGRGRHDGPSPYYKGLTDSALALRDLSPGRETYATGSTGARSFSSSVLIRFQEWGTFCFSRRGRDDDDEHEAGRAKTTSDGGGRRCSLCGSPRVEESIELGAGAGRCPAKPLDVRPSSEGLPAEANQKPSRERVVAEPALGNPVVCGGRKPLRESTSAPRVSIPEPWKDEKQSASESAEPVGPPLAAGSPHAPRQAREFYDPRISSGGGPTEAPAAVMVTTGGGKKERAFVWAERYRPRALEDFICNRAVATELRETVCKGECEHFIFEGPPGVGKKTMISALLREVFGPEKSKTKDEVKEFNLKEELIANIKVQANVKTSSQHIEINLSELHGYERYVVVQLIKRSPRFTSKDTMHCDHSNCQVIVLYEADKLSTDFQHYIRWLMEKNNACFKIIFCCSDASKLQPVEHLCKVVKLQPPSHSEIVDVLEYIAKNEGIDLSYNLAKKIADNAKQNLRQAIRSFEASCQSSYPFKEDQEILTGWEEDIANIAKSIIEEQSPRQLYSIREKLKKLIQHNVSPQFIFSTLQVELKKHLDGHYHTKLDDLCEEYKNDIQGSLDHQKSPVLSQGVEESMGRNNHDMRSFMTIEEFTAKFMSFYKSNVVKNVEGKNPFSI